jgi:hypothetical protein
MSMLRPLRIKRSFGWIQHSSSSSGFSGRDLNKLERLVEQNEAFFLEVWNEYFGRQ